MVDVHDPQTFSVSITNLLLGAGVVVCWIVVLWEAVLEALDAAADRLS